MSTREARDARVEQAPLRDCPSSRCSNEAFDQMRSASANRTEAACRPSPDAGNRAGFPPPLEIHDGNRDRGSTERGDGQNSMAVLFDKNSRAEDKLASVSKLYDSGARSITCTDKDGNEHKLRFEKLPIGTSGREMVHVFGTDQAGQQRTVLRGIANSSKGGFEHERDEQGKFVDYYGGGKALLDLTGSSTNQNLPPDRLRNRPDLNQDRPDLNRNRPDLDRNRPDYDRNKPDNGNRPNFDRNRPDNGYRPDFDPNRPDIDRNRPDYNRNRPDLTQDRPDLNPDRIPRNNTSRRALEPVTDPAILKDVGRRPDGSAVEPTYIGVDNSASYLGSDGQKHIKAGTPAWLDKPAAEAFVMMNEKLARVGKQIQIASGDSADGAINSAGRTHTQQRIATGLHAKPGNSVHEQGRGLDVRNYEDRDVRAVLSEFGFVQGNLSRPNVPIRGDAWHFSFAGASRR